MVDGYSARDQSPPGGHRTCSLRLWRSWHVTSPCCHGADSFSLVLRGICRRSVGRAVRPGVFTSEAARARAWTRFRSRALSSSRSCNLALLDRRSAANSRLPLFRTCCGPHICSRTVIVWKPPHHSWPEVVAVAADDRDERHTLRLSQGFHPTPFARRSTAPRRISALHLNCHLGSSAEAHCMGTSPATKKIQLAFDELNEQTVPPALPGRVHTRFHQIKSGAPKRARFLPQARFSCFRPTLSPLGQADAALFDVRLRELR